MLLVRFADRRFEFNRKNFPSQLDRIAPAESEEIPEPYGLDGSPWVFSLSENPRFEV